MSELEFWKDLGDIFDAVMTYQKKNVEFNNRFINPWIRLGNVFERSEKATEAVQAYQRATEIDPTASKNWIDLGDAQFKIGDFDQAIIAYGQAVKLDPEAGWPLGNLALSLVSQGRVEEAIPLYKKSIELLTEVKDKAVCWNRLGNAYRKLNDYENAFAAFQKADELDGTNTGFSDKLDETPENNAVVAPEEILDQMAEDEALQQNPAAVEDQAEPAVESVLQASDAVEESPLTLHDQPFDLSQVVEDQPVAISEAVEEAAPVVEAAIDAVEAAPVAEVVTEAVEEAAPVAEVAAEAVEEAAPVAEAVTESVEEVAPVALEEAPRRIPSWLKFTRQVKAQKKASELQPVVAENESITAMSMNTVETFTDSLVSLPQVEEEPEAVIPVKIGPDAETVPPVVVDQPVIEVVKEEPLPAAEPVAAEVAYEEYLKDVAQHQTPLVASANEIQGDVPLTRVAKNGEVRIAMDTKNAHVWNELGNIYFNAGNYDDAVSAYGKAVELDRDFAWPYSNLALAYVQKGRFAEAILLYQRSIELFTADRDKAITWNRLGSVYRRINDYPNAIAAYQTADELDPENATISLRTSFGLLGNMVNESKPALVS